MHQGLLEAQKFASLLLNRMGGRVISIVLFGSVARGTATPSSDIDLLVVLKDLPKGRLARRSILEPVLKDYEEAGGEGVINCHLKTADEARKVTVMYYDFPTDAILLHDRDGFFKAIIDSVSERIRKTGAQRKKWGRFYYWDLKPDAKAGDIFEIL